MTDDTRTRLRGAIELLVSMADRLNDPSVSTETGPAGTGFGVRVEVYGKSSSAFAPPAALTPFQQMCLAGLLGDPAQLESAVADYLLDAGHEYATSCYERGKRDGNPFRHLAERLQESATELAEAWAMSDTPAEVTR